MEISAIRVITGVLFFCLGLTAAIASFIFTTRMISEINGQRQADNQIDILGSSRSKRLRIFSEYRRLYPKGRLDYYANASFIAMMISLLIVAVSFHIIG